MTCKKIKINIPLYVYGELGTEEKSLFEDHIRQCPECRRELEETQKAFECLEPAKAEPVPDVDWDKSWRKIRSSVKEPEKRPLFRPFQVKSALAAAAVLLVFAAGIFIGRMGRRTSGGPEPFTASTVHLKQLLSSHFEDLKPVLLDYANFEPGEESGRIPADREIIHSLLVQNLLLKRLLSGENTGPVYGLLEDVDIILKDISNLNKGDESTPSLIRKAIHQRDILFKMEVLNKI